MKQCRKCKETKPFSDFHKNKTKKDGCCSRCKQCVYPSSYKKQELRKQGLKVCPKCKETKPFSDFNKNKANKDGCHSYCKQCRSNRVRSSPTNIYSSYKRDAKRRNYDFEITYSYFMSFWQKPCYYCGTEIKNIGLDRVDNNKGYVIGNVMACCSICNFAKSNLTKEEFFDHFICLGKNLLEIQRCEKQESKDI